MIITLGLLFFAKKTCPFMRIKQKGVICMVKIIHSDVVAVDRIMERITKMEGRRPRLTAVRPARSKETIFTIDVED